ncbi:MULTISPECIES: hypothetical protein [unclassified Nodularia (in: cyanobacteria)]|uniref:hypothetical protein n=1 Tax=unclassified Nodularia (in: cyanobacteria) TaxID=2656917 RepID=UPI001882BF79|nr:MULTISPECIES: hypothetical protein [unclassified Nodularia (in: cyanobacteria)]MBE9197583.1 hypothetical protein [Nodularia sp. LEGE 06071]MCC2692088.1 hypothetical protein [Nodularia sp. LEGE 04288]
MEPITLIITALVAGAAKAAGDAAPDVYNGLKALIKRKFESEPKAQMVLEEHEKDPETYEAPLKKKLAEAGADQDEEIIKAAQELLKQVEPEESASGKYNTVFQGEVKGAQIGDRNTQTNTFS